MTPRIVRLSLVVFLLAAGIRAVAQPPATVPGANPVRASDPLVSLKLSGADLDTVLGWLELNTGKTIIHPSALPTATYTLVIANPIPKSEAITAVETLLAMNGVAITPLNDRLLKATALPFAKNEAPEMITGSTLALPPSGRIATKVFQFDFLRAQEIVPQLASIFNPQIGGGVLILDKANAAMITDTVTNLQRVERLLKELDKPVVSGTTPKFYRLENGAKASDLVNKIRAAFGPTIQQQLGTSTTFSADDRTNQIILMADPRIYPIFDELIAKLDIKADPNTRNDIIYLKHAKALDVKNIITALVTGQNAATQRNAAQSVRPGQIFTPNQPGPLNVVQNPVPGVPANPNAPPTILNLPPGPSGIDGPIATNEFSTILNVVNDDRSNAIIVSGTADDVRLIQELVAKIDVILAQVNIEVIIAEVTLNNSQRSGLQALNLTVNTDTPAGPNGDGGHGTHITDFAGAVGGWAVTDGVVNPLAFKAALSDLGSRSNIKVLSVPTITTTHGKAGTVTVGEKRPIITSTSTATVNSAPQSQYQLTDIALVLKVTPLIGDDGSIQLEIDQKIDDVIGSVAVDANQVPIIGTRQAVSYLNVFDGEIRVLGGLQRTKRSRDRAKLGFIYEIPILSHLLGARTNIEERTELLIFIRPHVMRLNEGSREAEKAIDALSNKEQVKQFLKDPSVQSKDSLLEILR